MEKRPLFVVSHPTVRRDQLLSDCLALAVSVAALLALGMLLG